MLVTWIFRHLGSPHYVPSTTDTPHPNVNYSYIAHMHITLGRLVTVSARYNLSASEGVSAAKAMPTSPTSHS